MKVISLGLISSIIFSIVLAGKGSGSKSTGCFSFCRKKTKEVDIEDEPPQTIEYKKPKSPDYDPDLPNLKFIDEFTPIVLEASNERKSELSDPFTSETDGTVTDKITGFLIRENKSGRRGWYVRPYEEEYENMIRVKFTPLKNDFQSPQPTPNVVHNVGSIPLPPNIFINRKSSSISENSSSTSHEDVASTIREEITGILHGNQKLYEFESYFNDGENAEDQELDDEVASYLADGENVNDKELDEVISYFANEENVNVNENKSEENVNENEDEENVNENEDEENVNENEDEDEDEDEDDDEDDDEE